MTGLKSDLNLVVAHSLVVSAFNSCRVAPLVVVLHEIAGMAMPSCAIDARHYKPAPEAYTSSHLRVKSKHEEHGRQIWKRKEDGKQRRVTWTDFARTYRQQGDIR